MAIREAEQAGVSSAALDRAQTKLRDAKGGNRAGKAKGNQKVCGGLATKLLHRPIGETVYKVAVLICLASLRRLQMDKQIVEAAATESRAASKRVADSTHSIEALKEKIEYTKLLVLSVLEEARKAGIKASEVHQVVHEAIVRARKAEHTKQVWSIDGLRLT